ncbi:MAG TPA: GNAT family N-acetyltransferase [Bacteriovoracaceae bacterium]|nr:GNAT family N-acetyltransferase [Bacteriovoracaceae bacterium]
MNKITLVAYDLQDQTQAQEIFNIIAQYYEKSPWPVTVKKIMDGSVRYFRAEHQGAAVGLSGYTLKTPTLAETVKTTVFRQFQGTGLGHEVSQAIEEECRRIGVKKVMTTIYHFNHSMISIKLRQGYTIEGYHPDHEAPGFHEYSLGKVLS